MWSDRLCQSRLQSQASGLQLRRGGQPLRRKDVHAWASLLLLPLLHLLLIDLPWPLLRGGWQRGEPTEANNSTSTGTNIISTNQPSQTHNPNNRLFIPSLCWAALKQRTWSQGRRHPALRHQTPYPQILVRRSNCRDHLHRRHLLQAVATFWCHSHRGREVLH